MVKMRIPDGMGKTITVGGVQIEADSQGVVNVPDPYVEQLLGHGLVDISQETAALQAEVDRQSASERPRIRKTATTT
jgi:hypothetical protein